MAAGKNTRAPRARSVPRLVKRHPMSPDSPEGMLSAVRLRLKFVMAAAFAWRHLFFGGEI